IHRTKDGEEDPTLVVTELLYLLTEKHVVGIRPKVSLTTDVSCRWGTRPEVSLTTDASCRWGTRPEVSLATDASCRWGTRPEVSLATDHFHFTSPFEPRKVR
ncbi:hypothetical protein Tco_0197235, partial [Tanacetum coccineum]